MDNLKIKIISGTLNESLANYFSSNLGLNLLDVTIKKFNDKEIFVKINEEVNGYECVIIKSLCEPVNDNLIELLLIIDAVKRCSAIKIKLFIPYFAYARQDKIQKGEAMSARLVANLIETSGANEIFFIDIHSLQTLGFFNIPVTNIPSYDFFYNYIIENMNFDNENFILISPDCGSIFKTRNLSKKLNCPMVVIDKYREKANVSEVINVFGNVENKNLIIYDDIIDTAGTICNAAKILKEKGAKDIYVLASHAVLSGNAIDKIKKSQIKKFVFLNTIPVPKEKMLENFKIINMEPNCLAKYLEII